MNAYEQLATCPYCGYSACKADWCDVGVGYVQSGPWICDDCGATSIGAFDTNEVTEEEKKNGWYSPGKIGSTVNTFKGKPVGHVQANILYRAGILDEK